MNISSDILRESLKYLEICDVFAFVKSNKQFWNNKKLNKLFKDYYYDADMAFVGLAWKCYVHNINQRAMFLNLAKGIRKYRFILYHEFGSKANRKLAHAVIPYHIYYSEPDVKKEKIKLMNLPNEHLKNINWIWLYESYTNCIGMSISDINYICGPYGVTGDIGRSIEPIPELVSGFMETEYGDD